MKVYRVHLTKGWKRTPSLAVIRIHCIDSCTSNYKCTIRSWTCLSLNMMSVVHVLLCYFVTLLFCPLHQSGKDLSLLLKLSKVGALTTADGKSFQ